MAFPYKTGKNQGVDTAGRITANQAKKLKSIGMDFVGRYLGGSYAITKNEVNMLHSAGLHVFLYYERGAGDVKQGASKGKVQGADAYNNAVSLGVPKGACIYFACDQSATTTREFNNIEAYLRAAKSQLRGQYLCGIYGSYYVIEEMYKRKAADRFCQCVAWSQKKVSDHLNIYQYEWDSTSGAKAVKAKTGVGVDLVYCPNLNAAGMWLTNGTTGNSGISGMLSNVGYSVTTAVSGLVSSATYKPGSSKVFVPRTVAPKSDEKWWKVGINPCLSRSNGTVLPNCFTGSTEIITNQGVISLKKAFEICKKSPIEVPTIDNGWNVASVKYFGIQRIYKVRLQGSTYYCTGNHRWYVYIGKNKKIKEVTTTELTPSMKIPYRMCNTEYGTRVLSVEDTGVFEGVYCVVEPVTHSFTLSGGEITGNCVGYAYGRFAEILGYFHPELPHSNGGKWLDDLKSKGSTSLKWGSTPKLGAVGVWKKSGGAGHVAIVEYIYKDGTIMLSESGYSASWRTRFWTSGPRSSPNWYGSSYQFQGFIYNPGTEGDIWVAPFSGGIKYGTPIPENSPRYNGSWSGDSSLLTSMAGELASEFSDTSSIAWGTYYATAPDHPARKFVRTIMLHVGKDGHDWVKKTTGVTTRGWSAATCCAASKECEFGELIPTDIFSASSLGQQIVKTYGGHYILGAFKGGTDKPQIGDIFAICQNKADSEYAATRVGVVREISGDTILTVEGDLHDSILLNRRRMKDIAWYARPDWTKAGGTEECKSLFQSPLYTTSSSRADATLREVAYLTESAEPSISSTSTKLSAINYTNILSGIYDAAGYSNIVTMSGMVSGDYCFNGGDTVDSSGIQPTNARLIFEFLTGKGLSAAQSIGFLANIQQESNFSTSAVNPSSKASGICQWLGGRKTAMMSACGSSWANNLTGQCEYLWSELNGAESKTLTRLKSEVTGNDEASAELAAEIVVRQFERPGHYDTEVPKRKANARKFWSMIIVMQNGSGTFASSGANGTIVTRSGKQLSSGNAIPIPSSVKQTGIVANSTNWSRFFSRWSRRVNQGKLADIWASQGRPSKYYVATISGYYLVAVTTKFGMPGDIISVVLEDGTYFNAIIGDSKGANVAYSPHKGETGNEYGHAFGHSGVDIIEWEANGGSQSSLRAGLQQAGWYGKKVVKIIHYGSWIDG